MRLDNQQQPSTREARSSHGLVRRHARSSSLGVEMFVPRACLHALKDLLLLRVELVLRERATVKQPFQLGQFIHALVC